MDEPLSNTPLFIASLLRKHLKGNLTPDELQELNTWIAASERHQRLWKEINDAGAQQEAIRQMAQYNGDAALEVFLAKHSPAPARRVHFLWRWQWAAAVFVIALAAGAYFLLPSKQRAPAGFTHNAATGDIAPGRNGAILKLADGSQVALDSLQNGTVATQNGASIVLSNGQLVYNPGTTTNKEVAYNIITTPNGRQFRVTLPDGTQAWLNAASSIRYPVVFAGKHRNVEVTGEVYFEVAQNAAMPFQVAVGSHARIDVLGTRFNVNAYDNEESLNTTLLEGAVRVVPLKTLPETGNGIILRPGQQLQLSDKAHVIDRADVDKIMAWKNGFFDFDGMDLRYAMKQVARWYDVEIVYRGNIPDIKFYGKINRNISLAGLIRGLSGTGVHLNIEEGKRLVVTQ